MNHEVAQLVCVCVCVRSRERERERERVNDDILACVLDRNSTRMYHDLIHDGK